MKNKLLKKENKIFAERLENISQKSSTRIQILGRLNNVIASSFERERLFKHFISELSKYFSLEVFSIVLKNEDDGILVFDQKSEAEGRKVQDISFSSLARIFSDIQIQQNIKNYYKELSTLLLPQNLNNQIYAFTLMIEEKVNGYLIVTKDSSISPDEHLFFTDTASLLSSALQNVITFNQRNFIHEQFGRSVDNKVRDYLLSHKDDGSILNVSVMFLDIRNFTSLSEKLGPTESVALLNKIFSYCDTIIRANSGFINKFTGDGFMAVFGAPIPCNNHQEQSINAALEILSKTEVPCGIGISSGNALAGTIGSTQRKEYTVIGDTVNTASRVEGLCKVFSSSLMVTSNTYLNYKDTTKLTSRYLGKIRLKGKASPVEVYDLYSKDVCYSKDFDKAISLYYQKDFSTSLTILEQLEQSFQNDKAILWYKEKCQKRMTQVEDWDGIEQMTEK